MFAVYKSTGPGCYLVHGSIVGTNLIFSVKLLFQLNRVALSGSGALRHQSPGQPAYDPACLLKLYLYGYLNQGAPADFWNGSVRSTSK